MQVVLLACAPHRAKWSRPCAQFVVPVSSSSRHHPPLAHDLGLVAAPMRLVSSSLVELNTSSHADLGLVLPPSCPTMTCCLQLLTL
jgi:hypothetical protein